MIWKRDQYIAHCQHQFTGREMFCELFGPLLPLEAEWCRQGASEKEIGMIAFDWDYVLKTHLAVNTGAMTGCRSSIGMSFPRIASTMSDCGNRKSCTMRAI